MTASEEKQGFCRRLKEAMRRARVEAAPTRFAREFNLRYAGDSVTAQTARKWLHGRALPTQDKLRALAQWLEVTPQWLRYAEAESPRAMMQDRPTYAVDSAWIGRKFDLLSEPHRRMVLEVVRALLRLEGKQ